MYLIIGGSGFIGTYLCKNLFKSRIKFSIIDKRVSNSFPDKTIQCDIRDKNKLLKNDIQSEVLINLAAEHRDDVRPRTLYEEVNVKGAEHICSLAEKNNINKIIFTSSVAVYGFAEDQTDENGEIRPFNEYGKTKHKAELIYKRWQEKDPNNRSLIIIRPTVVFGKQNRGNVYNLMKQIASGYFITVGNGENRKSMAYVENVAAFIEHSTKFSSGTHVYNYVDKPDYKMNQLILKIKCALGKTAKLDLRIPFSLGLIIGYAFDFYAYISNQNLQISSIRIKKFCKNSTYSSLIESTGFTAPVKLDDAINSTIRYEFIEKNNDEIFFSE